MQRKQDSAGAGCDGEDPERIQQMATRGKILGQAQRHACGIGRPAARVGISGRLARESAAWRRIGRGAGQAALWRREESARAPGKSGRHAWGRNRAAWTGDGEQVALSRGRGERIQQRTNEDGRRNKQRRSGLQDQFCSDTMLGQYTCCITSGPKATIYSICTGANMQEAP
jgi:hypothetical protein